MQVSQISLSYELQDSVMRIWEKVHKKPSIDRTGIKFALSHTWVTKIRLKCKNQCAMEHRNIFPSLLFLKFVKQKLVRKDSLREAKSGLTDVKLKLFYSSGMT